MPSWLKDGVGKANPTLSFLTSFAMNLVIIFTAKYLFIISIAIYLYILWKLSPKVRKQILLFSIITFPLSYLIAKISSMFIYDPRPFVIEHVKPLIAHAVDNGFPSDHMLLTMTIAAVVFVYNRKWGITLSCIAVFIGTARVLAKVHHIEDIVGSLLIAVIATYIVKIIFPSISKIFLNK